MPSQSSSRPLQISAPGVFGEPLQRWLPGMLLSQTQTPFGFAQAPEPTVHALPIWNGSSTLPSQSLSRLSQPLVVSSTSWYVAGYGQTQPVRPMHVGFTPAQTPIDLQTSGPAIGLSSTTPSQSLSWPSRISTPPFDFSQAVSQPGTFGSRS